MGTIICFISDQFADFEITLACHKLTQVGQKQVLCAGYNLDPVMSESGLTYKPDLAIKDALNLHEVEGLLIPGGPIRDQKEELTELIQKLDQEEKLLAAVCNGPQYLGRAGVLNRRQFTTSCAVERIIRLGVADPFPREQYLEQRVVQDGHVITAKGRAFVDFSFAIFDYLDIYRDKQAERDQLFADIMDR
ncbi:DJ-1/PfpI family protein [Paenibacillus rigui]|uniref:Thiamine biosynthesis protein ThiJ n=1 Tax=Paenibacillus rigui TaxID=554312 RepID=A0A229UXM2_9BACL|nr:DJ-1/PfpI family protein [Paenibacillus rigui]OXM87709.1 thiamine biosynthesis protein ThiJ [Paenibacillus rigui]